MRRGVAVLGSTGSIGTSTLQVIERLSEHFHVVALTAGRNVQLLIEQARRFRPRFVALASREDAAAAREALGAGIQVGWGPEALVEAASLPEASIVVTAVVGAVGIPATIAALQAGKRVALANKESLVAAGELVTKTAAAGEGEIIPVDSEHSALHQCLRGEATKSVSRLWLTASGGPFRTWPLERMRSARPEEALQHPTWRMGGKITIDSATLMNKGLEVLEAYWLFGVALDRIDVVVHPQSIVHSMVEFVDGSILAQMGPPDMKGPIQYALRYPQREQNRFGTLSLTELGTLTFEPPDTERFPALRLAYEAGRMGGTAPAALSAANEVAVSAYLEGRIGFLDIARCVEDVLGRHRPVPADSLESVLAADEWARAAAWESIAAVGTASQR